MKKALLFLVLMLSGVTTLIAQDGADPDGTRPSSSIDAPALASEPSQTSHSEKNSQHPAKKFLQGYYPNWGQYSGFKAENIRWNYYTHILYAFYLTDDNGNIHNSDPGDEPNFKKILELGKKNNVGIILSIGGAFQSANFRVMAGSESGRKNFTKNVIEFCHKNGLAGFDIDWEYPQQAKGDDPEKTCPGCPGMDPIYGSPDADTRNQEILYKHIRQELDKYEKEHGRKIEFSSAVPASGWWARWTTTEAFMQLDYLNVMTYDYMGTWEKKVLPNSGMDMSIASFKYYEGRGIPKSKLVMGAAFYGKSFENATGLGSTYTGKGSGQDGTWLWKKLIEQFGVAEYKIVYDSATNSEYALGNEEIIVFNGVPSTTVRGEYIRNSEYPGLMFWDMLSDTHDRKLSLLVALYRGLYSR